MKAGTSIQLTPKGLESIEKYGDFELNTPYILGNDGSDSCPWFIRNPKGGNRVFINIDEHCEPYTVKERLINVYEYIILEQPVERLTVGNHYKVEAININGSYMVRADTGYSSVPVSPEKARGVPSLGIVAVNCRCHTFHGVPLMPPAPPMAPPVPQEKQPMKPVPQIKANVISEAQAKSIKKQKAVAVDILKWASIIDGDAFLAGGAPRNWALNRAAKDLDIFLRIPTSQSEAQCKRALELFGVTNVINMATHNPDGSLKTSSDSRQVKDQNRVSNIVHVFEGQYEGETVQFIYVANSSVMGLTYVQRYFDTSINMIVNYLDRDAEGLLENAVPAYDDTMRTGVIFVQENRSSYSSTHLERVASYFPNQPLVHWDNRSRVASDPSKAWDYHRDWSDFNTSAY